MSGPMYGLGRWAGIALASLACLACRPADGEPSHSLVGTDALPSVRALSLETVQINRGSGGEGFGDDFLSYELRPDNRLIITHTSRREGRIRAEEEFRLPSPMANDVRKSLWRVRPMRLAGVEHETRPSGCYARGPHDLGKLVVVFIDPPEKIGIFALPGSRSCSAPAAEEARRLMDQVMNSLPASSLAAGFDKAYASKPPW